MDKERKLKYQHEVEKYLEENKIYHIFDDMLRALIIKKPSDPLEFLIKHLSEPDRKLSLSYLSKKNIYHWSARLKNQRIGTSS
jgi:hypothetical protein